MLKVTNLVVDYGQIHALRDISFTVNKGEIVTLIGGNGAGKTTTLMSISNLVPRQNGKIEFKGSDISSLSPEKSVQMGLSHVPEGRRIFPQLTVYENLMVGSMGNPKLTKQQKDEFLEQTFVQFPRLKERIKQPGGNLSGGEQQMLAIARGLMMDPDLIMLDEPSLGLAPIVVEEIFELILQIKEAGKTVLLIEQNASMALSIADKGYVLETGKIILKGKGKELLNNPEIIKAYLGG